MDSICLSKKSKAFGTVNLPGSKSLSNRALLLSALSSGSTVLKNLLKSDDTDRMIEALSALGVTAERHEDLSCRVERDLSQPLRSCDLFLGNAGTAMRPLTAVLAADGNEGHYVLTGEPRMYERPIKPLTDALTALGASIKFLGKEGFPPLEINGRKLHGGTVTIDGTVSSQFITAILMAAPLASGDITINISGDLISKPYVLITLDLMRKFGVNVEHDGFRSFFIKGGQHYVSPGEYLVEGDASSASYFLAAGAIAGKVRVTGVGSESIQGDIKFAEALGRMGAKIAFGSDFIEAEKSELHGIDEDFNLIPDSAMTIVPLAVFADSPTVIRNVGSWRIKETDRLKAMATELAKIGVRCEEGDDYIRIIPPEKLSDLRTAAIDTYNDHRMAMCFSLISFAESITINDPSCTKKTFPGFFSEFGRICS